MNTPQPQGEVRPPVTPGDPSAEPYAVPLYALRRREWRTIPPEACRLGPSCLVCQWRRAGLLDPPTFALKTVVREPGPDYWVCPSSYCPGCNTVRCVCPPVGFEDADYALGHEHGRVDGPENRPSRRWLTDAGLDPDAYLDGYDDGCDGLPLHPATPVATPPVLWDDLDDGLPF